MTDDLRALLDGDAAPDEWHALFGTSANDAPQFLLLADPFSVRGEHLLMGLDYAYPQSVKIGGLASGRSASSVPITGRDTVLNVLTQNPPSSNAWLSQIKIIRPGRTPEENQEFRINFYDLIARGDMRQNVLLQEGDILYVPPTPMAWVGYRVRELLQPVAPAIATYQTPAQIINADSVYDNLNGSSGASSGSRTLGNLTLP